MVAPQRSGEIATRALPSLLLDLHGEAATGTLSLRRAGVGKTVELLHGAPVRVTSTLRDETLGHFLVKSSVITEPQHRDAVQRAAQNQARLGETLVAMGVFGAHELYEQLHHQDRHKLVAALRWPQGAWRFEPGDIAETGVSLPMVELVLIGLRDSGATVLDRLRRFDGASYELTARGRQIEPELRHVFGEAVTDALVRGGAITAIERACGDRFLARNALDAAELCGAVSSQRLPASALAAFTAGGNAIERRPPALAQGESQLPRGVAPRRQTAIPRITDRPAAAPALRTPSGAVPAPQPAAPMAARPVTVTNAARMMPAAAPVRPSAPNLGTTATAAAAPSRSSSPAISAAPTRSSAPRIASAALSASTQPLGSPTPILSNNAATTAPAAPAPPSRGSAPRIISTAAAAPTQPLRPSDRPTVAAHSRAAVYPAAATPAAAPLAAATPAAAPLAAAPALAPEPSAVDESREPEPVASSRAYTSPLGRTITPFPESFPGALGAGFAHDTLESSYELDLERDVDDERDDDGDRHSSRTTTRREVWLPRTETNEGHPFLPRTITSAAESRTTTPWRAQPPHPLYDLLFDEPQNHPDDGAIPLTSLDASSGRVSPGELDAANEHSDAAMRMRRALVAEAQRIRTADLYTILMVDRGASDAEIATAIAERQRAFAREYYSRFALGFDRPRLEEVLAAYAGARNILLDDEARRSYDRALAGNALSGAAHTLDAEVAFREAEDLLARQHFPEAIALLENLVARAPAQADFHAALGWAHWLSKGPSASAGDTARPHLNRALEIDPEHISAHVYRGIVGTLLGEDDAEVLFHLERALELQPAHAGALEHLEPILIRRGELRRLERLYKRLLFRLSTNFALRAAEIWLGLAQLYTHHLDEHEAAAIAISNAETLAPSHPHVAELAQQLRAATIAPRHPLEAARAQLRRSRDPGAAAELIRSAGETGQHDAAFLTAATMVALGTADARMVLTYERHRPRGALLPEEPLTAKHWAKLRHPDDVADLGLLIDIVAPAIAHIAPIELAEAGIDPTMRVADHELPTAFARLRKRLSHLLGVSPPPVYARPELERQIQLVACVPPALIAGDDALTAPERPELVCRLARALSHAQPGRAVGGSRSGTVLRAVVLSVIREASYSAIGERDPLAADVDAALDILDIKARGDVRAAALRLLARGNGLNLSVWSNSLPRTADRAGLLLCSDVPTALAIAKESGHLERDLIEFAFSAEHAALRASLGLAIAG